MPLKTFNTFPFNGHIPIVPSGWILPPFGCVDIESVTLTTTYRSRTYFSRIAVGRNTTFVKALIGLVTASSGGSGSQFEFALYNDNGLGSKPTGNPFYIWPTAISSASTAGYVGPTGSIALDAGIYWSAITYRYSTAPSTYPTVNRISSSRGALNLPTTSLNNQVHGYYIDSVPAGAWANVEASTLVPNSSPFAGFLQAA